MARLTFRIDFDDRRALGPGKIRLLEVLGQTGLISAAGRALGMSDRRAWKLVDALNQTFREPVVETRGGGVGGGGAILATFGASIVADYRAMEDKARRTGPASHQARARAGVSPEVHRVRFAMGAARPASPMIERRRLD